jgi:GT2 family glycosyltransferase
MNSPTDIVCLIDDDLVPEPEWLANIRASFLADERIGGVTGPTIIPPERRANRDLMFFLVEANARGNIILRIFAKLYLAVVLENKIHQVGRILKSGFFTPGSNFPPCRELPAALEVDYLEACHMCFRRRLFEELGGFDTAYTGTGEWSEPDFSFRVRQKGWRLVFNPQAATYHYISRGGVFQARTNSYERSRNFIRFYRRWVKPNTPEKFFRFSANLLFINFYWCYKFLQTGNFDWLRGIAGTFGGLLKDKNA